MGHHLDHRLAGRKIVYGGAIGLRLPAHCLNLGNDSFGLLRLIAIIDRNVSTFTGQRQGNPPADTSRAAGNQCNTPFKLS